MAIAFPTTGLTANVTTYSYLGRTWLWTGTVWQSVGTVSGAQGATGSTGPQGATGQSIQGATGQSIQGATGSAATVAVGTTTTGAAATAASVTNSGTTSAATFNFTIPQGVQGATGAASTVQGPTGTAATVAVGTTFTGAAATAASVQNVGTSSAATLQFVIPQGIQGPQGTQGIQGTTLALRNAQTTNYTIVPGDSGLIVSSTGTGTQYLSIPTNAAQAITTGSQIHFVGMSTGTYTIQAVTSGTTSIQSTGATVAKPVLRAQYSMATAIKLATDAWIVTGDIS